MKTKNQNLCKNCGIHKFEHERHWKNGDNFPCKKFEAQKRFKPIGTGDPHFRYAKPKNHSPQENVKRGKTTSADKLADNLSLKRTELYREMCKILPDFKWGLLFERIMNQDKVFIKKLKERFPREITDDVFMSFRFGAMIDKLAGKDI